MVRAAVAPALVLSLVLAGCAGDSPGKAGNDNTTSAAPPTVSGEFGSITGTVLNEEMLPIGGAHVGIPTLPQASQIADAQGKFTFNDIPPGSYAVHAEQLGYESKAKKVTVVAGEVTTVEFILIAIATPGIARHLSYVADGFIELAVVVPTYGVYYFNNTGENLNFVAYAVAEDVSSSVMGLQWQTSAPFTGRLVRMNTFTCKPVASCTQVNFTRALSPLVIRSDGLQETVEGKKGYFVAGQWYPTSCTAISNDFCVSNPDTIIEVTAQQRYKLYTTVFFVDPAPLPYDPLPS